MKNSIQIKFGIGETLGCAGYYIMGFLLCVAFTIPVWVKHDFTQVRAMWSDLFTQRL
jgi:hypothetical protein